MRAERRREREEQLKSSRNSAKSNIFFLIVSGLYIASLAGLLFFIFKLNVIPGKFLWPGVGVLALITLLTVPALISSKAKRGRKIASSVICIILILGFGAGIYYLQSTQDFLSDITRRATVTEGFHVVVRTEDGLTKEETDGLSDEKIDELALSKIDGMTVGTFTSNDEMYDKAKDALKEKTDVTYSDEESARVVLDKLSEDKLYDAVFVPAASYEALKSEEGSSLEEDTVVIYTLQVEKENADTTKAVKVTKEPFNVYIMGVDAGGIRTDVNMIATVNPSTHKVLLTSIPRDYYIELPSKGAKDKLTHSSIYGIDETFAAVEKAFSIDINYFVKVNFEAVKGVVDAIGGIDVESQYDFTTSGMQGLDGTHFVKGINHVNGDEALAFARERHSFASGDMARNENQQAVVEAIIKKVTSSSTILTSYTSVLGAISGNMETDLGQTEMSALVKMQLSSMPSWDIDKVSVKGGTGSAFCYALGSNASVVFAEEAEITKAHDAIMAVMNGESESEDEEKSE